MAGLEMMTAGQIRDILVNKYGYTEDQVSRIRSKNLLAIELQQAMHNINQEEESSEFFNSLEVEQKSIEFETGEGEQTHESPPPIPLIGSPDWQSYVLAHLLPGEYFEKDNARYPKCAGLRRVAQVLLGDIIESGPTMVFPPEDRANDPLFGAGRATVVYEIKIAWKNSPVSYIDLSDVSPSQCDIRIFREVADAWSGNTPELFSMHPSATAATRAEGRALKKALQLNIHTAEEMISKDDSKAVQEQLIESDGKFKDDAPITGAQQSSINRLTKRLKINKDKFILHFYPDSDSRALTSYEGSNLCGVLNQYQSKGKGSLDIPEEIKEIDDNSKKE